MLLNYYGKQEWWPAESALEIVIGAILVQGTNWRNAANAIEALKRKNMLSVDALSAISHSALAKTIRPAGFQRIKARRIKNFIEMLTKELGGSIERLLSMNTDELRNWLLRVPGIGKETADNIILYAAGKLVFPVDNYTVRLLSRLGIFDSKEYEQVRAFIESKIPRSLEVYREFRALIVRHCKEFCRSRPRCSECFLRKHCRTGLMSPTHSDGHQQ